MTILCEFKVNKTIFDEIKNDPGSSFGFEAEFHVHNASDLLRDQTGQLPRGFETYGPPPGTAYDDYYGDDDSEGDVWSTGGHDDITLIRLSRLFESYLGLGQGQIELAIPHAKTGYQNWTLTTDASLYSQPIDLADMNNDMGVELVSPVMALSDGLAWMAKICEMIAKFQHGNLRLYTSPMCSIHINLSHVLIEYDPARFDFAKLAIMGGDEHYLADFRRTGNRFAKPILQAVYNELVAARENRPVTNPSAALDLLKLRDWNASRVMYDLSTLIPLGHYMSIDFRRLTSTNPYVEIRVAGNTHYEQRVDEIAKMAIRYAALIKIACDPNAYRDEYLKKVYQLVSGAAAPVVRQNPMPRIRIYLQPVMSRASRAALDQIETYVAAQSSNIPNAPYLVLTILRSAIDMRLARSLRIRDGLKMLLDLIGLKTADLMRSLNDVQMLTRYGVMRMTEKPGQTIAMLTNAIKQIDQSANRPQAAVQRPSMPG